ncbi:hypothetical protein G9C98_003432 [Cotesia typhae]|uniref:Serpin domain-containing protein n=1 Tax=Cotesia typhae TaxID=2053667 RepID=A0A8J5QQ94_9HYME|nr:hypothetical protein G9C98_003432 [Cotesia typhae]
MAYYITWIVGAILIVHNFGNILTASVPETEEISRHVFQGIRQFSQEFYHSSTDSDSTTMFIILPNTVGGLPKAEESIPKLNIKGLFENQHETLVNLWLPKFKIETMVAMPMSAPIFPTPPIDVKVDHPFAFILYHHETDTILFQGHVTSPSK